MVLLSSTTFFIGALGAVSYAVITRFILWRRLRHIPGPLIAGWTKLWLLRHVVPGKLCTKLVDICNEYGRSIHPNTARVYRR
jgi:hypothetical protein